MHGNILFCVRVLDMSVPLYLCLFFTVCLEATSSLGSLCRVLAPFLLIVGSCLSMGSSFLDGYDHLCIDGGGPSRLR